MTDVQHDHAPPTPVETSPRRPGAWPAAVAASAVLIAALGWLLARLVWLWFYFGLFFFLVAGLLVGGVTFRVARRARPVSRGALIIGVTAAAVAGWLATVNWEYRHVAATIGDLPRFAEARNAAVKAGRAPSEVGRNATDAFRQALRDQYAPGGPIGYVRWAVAAGEMPLTVEEFTETVAISHQRLKWPIRSAACVLLLAAGLWFCVDALRSAVPVSNFLAPGEEAVEDDS